MRVTFSVLERTTQVLTALIRDEKEIPIPGSALTTFTLTLYVVHTLGIINGRSAQNVLNLNGVTVDGNGVVTWTMQPADNIIADETMLFERHRALFEWTYASGKAGKEEIDLLVQNLAKVL